MTDDDLLLYLDGELGASRSRQVKTHLQSCWRCRVRSEKIERAVTEFVERRHAWTDAAPPPGGWARFEAELAKAAAQPVVGRFRLPAVAWRVLWRTPAVAAALCALAALLYLNWMPRVSASEVLERAESTERGEIGSALEPVVYQKFEVRRSRGSRTAVGTVEAWSDVKRARHVRRGGEEVWNDLEMVLRRNHMAAERPLSAASYRSWSNALRSKQETVSEERLEDGVETLSLQTIARGEPEEGDILTARLVLRAQDWHPVQENLQVHTAGGIQEFALTELAFHVVAAATLDASLFGDTPVPPRALAAESHPRSTPPARIHAGAPAPDPSELEVRVREALHRAGACLREPMEVVREASGGLAVRGLTENSERKAALLALLEPIAPLRIELETVEEAARHTPPDPVRTIDSSAVPVQEVKPVTTPLQRRLGSTLSPPQVAELSNQAITCSGEWVSHAGALERLRQAFPPERARSLPENVRSRLEGMVEDHAAAIGTVVARCRSALSAVLPAAGQSSAVEGTGDDDAELLKRALAAQQLTCSLFLEPSPREGSVDETLQHLSVVLTELEAQAARRAQAAASWRRFESEAESAGQNSRRKP